MNLFQVLLYLIEFLICKLLIIVSPSKLNLGHKHLGVGAIGSGIGVLLEFSCNVHDNGQTKYSSSDSWFT